MFLQPKHFPMTTDTEIFIGTSQDYLLSFKVNKTDEDELVLERLIAHRCHNGSIICMDTKGRYLATGGGDDRIVVIDLKLNRDVHEIIRHKGSIRSLSFSNKGTELLSNSDDGRIIATTVGSWKSAKIWKKPHTGKAVQKVCLHPTDKFALSLGKDGTLRGWDMLKGTQIAAYNTSDFTDAGIGLDDIVMSPDGGTFVMSGAKTVTIISFSRSEPRNDDELLLNSRVTSMYWLDAENLLIGMENGSIEWLTITMDRSEHTNLPNIHCRRIKGMHHLNSLLGTVSSSGTISLWAVSIPTKQLTLLCTYTDESIRPTCIRLIDITKNRSTQPMIAENVHSEESFRKKSKTIPTVSEVFVETDGNDDREIVSPDHNWTLSISDDDTDTEFAPTTVTTTTAKNDAPPAHTTSEPLKAVNEQSTHIDTMKSMVVRSLDFANNSENMDPEIAATSESAFSIGQQSNEILFASMAPVSEMSSQSAQENENIGKSKRKRRKIDRPLCSMMTRQKRKELMPTI